MEAILSDKVRETLKGTIILRALTKMYENFPETIMVYHGWVQEVDTADNVIGVLEPFEAACLQVAFDLQEEHDQRGVDVRSWLNFKQEITWLVNTAEMLIRVRIPLASDNSSTDLIYRKNN